MQNKNNLAVLLYNYTNQWNKYKTYGQIDKFKGQITGMLPFTVLVRG